MMVIVILLFIAVFLMLAPKWPTKLKGTEPKRLDPVDFSWGDGKDFSSLLDPEMPKLISETTLMQIEQEWDKAHPSTESKLEKALKDNETLRKQLNKLRNQVDNFYAKGYQNMPPATLVNIPNQLSESEIQELIKKISLQLAKHSDKPGSYIILPQRTILTAAPITARMIEEKVDSADLNSVNSDGKELNTWSAGYKSYLRAHYKAYYQDNEIKVHSS